jgi:RND family efflux transporter MFP subunit
MEDLYKSGAASKDQYDQVKLQADSSENSYTQAKLQYDTAVVDYEYKSDLLNESKIYSGNDGTVISIPYEENERVTANTPIVIVRSENQVVHIGIAQQDLKKIEIGRSAFVDVDGEVASGVINYIADAPDSSTRTYDVEIKIDGKEFPMGAIAKVSIDAGTEKGFWVPMNSIFSNGEDYVYIVREGRAFKQLVELKDVSDDKIRVDGLNEGDFLAVSGMKNLSDGGKVNVLEEVDDEQANSTTN